MYFCSTCGSRDLAVTRVSREATTFGLPSGTLSNVERIECAECGEISIQIPAQGAVIKEYRKQLALLGRELTADEFVFLRRSLGMTGKAYAEAMQISNVTVSRIENGGSIPSLQQALIRSVTLVDILSLELMKQFVGREGDSVNVDAAAVARGQHHEVTKGWQSLPHAETLPSNVVPFRRTSPLATKAVEFVVIETGFAQCL